MRLHNRQIKATFWTDPDLLQWPRDKRWFYIGLVQLADDSGCLEDSPFAFKVQLFPSPLDSDITIEQLAKWCEELIEQKKLVRYQANGKTYLYIVNFHKHQTVKNASPPSVPLPPWITWETYSSNNRTGRYAVNYEVLTEFLQSSYNGLTTFLQSSSNITGTITGNITGTCIRSIESRSEKEEPNTHTEEEGVIGGGEGVSAPNGADPRPSASVCVGEILQEQLPLEIQNSQTELEQTADSPEEKEQPKVTTGKRKTHEYSPEFLEFWRIYPRKVEKLRAWKAWQARIRSRDRPEDMIQAAKNYAEYCLKRGIEEQYIKHPATFIGPSKPYEDWINPQSTPDMPKAWRSLKEWADKEGAIIDPG